MTEGRRSQVVLLDDRRLDILIQPKLYAGELLDMVASHFNLKERDYFGLAYQDETGHYNWLQLDRRVLEHDFPKKNNNQTLTLFFLVKYFAESLSHLRDSATVEAFYLQAKSLLFKGTIEVDSATAFELAALVLQATHGDYVDDETAKSQLKKLPVLPTSAYVEHPSISVCEDKVIEFYKEFVGLSRGSAIIKYLSIVESQPTYGVHYYQVKDKGSIPWWLGLSQKGISQYDQTDRKTPRRVFLWKQLENLYFRDRKFSIEVHDYKRVSVSRRTFGPGNVTVCVWFASTPNLTKCIWSMAISQHKFYLNRKHSSKPQSSGARNLGQIAAELTRSSQSLSSSCGSAPNLSRSASSHSLPALKIEGGDESRAMLSALRAKKEALEEALLRKTAELKALCIQEGEITGELPPDTPLAPSEKPPQVRRRVGTSFALSDRLISTIKTKEEEAVAKLELDFEIQTKISSAALQLANDGTAKKNVRRQRTISYQQAHAKLKEIEKKLVAARKQAESKMRQMRQASDEEPSEDSVSHSTDDSASRDKIPASIGDSSPALHHMQLEDANNRINRVLLTCPRQSKTPSPSPSSSSSSLRQSCGTCPSPVSVSAPPSPSKHRHTAPGTLEGQGYRPSAVYQTKLSYRSHHYPTLPLHPRNGSDYDNVSTGSSSGLSAHSPYRNRFESSANVEGSNLYSVSTQRTSQAYDSQDDSALSSSNTSKSDFGVMSRHNSLDSMRRQNYQKQHYHQHHSHPQSPQQLLPPRSPSYDAHLLHHHHLHHMAYYRYQKPPSIAVDCVDANPKPEHSDPLASRMADVVQKRPTILPLSPRCIAPPDPQRSMTPISVVHPQQWTSGQQPTSPMHSPKPKTREWVETSLDSPTPTRKNRPTLTSPLRSASPAAEKTEAAFQNGVEVNVVSVGHFQPYWEETKPYEMADFYKYSTKHRQREKNDPAPKMPSYRQTQVCDTPEKSSDAATCPPGFLNGANSPMGASAVTSPDGSFTLDGNCVSVAEAFHEEMLAWFEDQDKVKKATLV